MLLKWLKENLKRWFKESPAFFKWWNRIASFFLIVSGIPYLIVQFEIIFNYVTPEWLQFMSNKFVAGCAIGARFMAGLTVDSPVVAQTVSGGPIMVGYGSTLPYTLEKEKQKIEKSDRDIPVIEDATYRSGGITGGRGSE